MLAQISPDQFCGDTAFHRLSAEQKLLWLVHAAAFTLEARSNKDDTAASDKKVTVGTAG